MRVTGLRQGGLIAWQRAQRLVDAASGSAHNPLRQLGAVAFLAFWVLLGSGIVLYVLFDTSVDGAYRSISGLAGLPLGVGVLLRGLHRYAADLFVVAMGLHLLREWLAGHERGLRRFAWLTGVPLIGFVFACAIGGFWLSWDQLGQFSAIATAEWIDALPLLAAPLARNFLGAQAVGDRLFSLFIFVHIGVPLLLLFGLWFHVQRLSRAAVLPPRPLALGLLAMLVLLALAAPVTSHAPAELAQVPAVLRLDWILLFIHPLSYATSPVFTWAVVIGGALLLFALPFVPRSASDPAVAPPVPVAVVDPANCNGCQRCFADCPYAAITMVPHPNLRIGRTLAVVDADQCAACGICAGACPSSTPFRSGAHLLTGIDMPQRRIGELRERLQRALQASTAQRPLVVFGCDHGLRGDGVADGDVIAISLLCSGQLPPSFVEYALRDGAAGVLVATCPSAGCEYRLGERWTVERLQGRRDPRLRPDIPLQRLEVFPAGPGDEARLARALQQLRMRVQSLADGPQPAPRHA